MSIHASEGESTKSITVAATSWKSVTTQEGRLEQMKSDTTRISSSRRFTTSALWKRSLPCQVLRIALSKTMLRILIFASTVSLPSTKREAMRAAT